MVLEALWGKSLEEGMQEYGKYIISFFFSIGCDCIFKALKWVIHIVNAIRDGHIAACEAKEYANAYVDCYLKKTQDNKATVE